MKIQKTVIISLPERKEDRLIPLQAHIKEFNWLNYEVYEAVKLSDGKLGLIVSVADILSKLLEDKEISCVLVCEDDFRFLQEPNEIVEKCLGQLPSNFDLCYLGCNLWQTHIHKYSQNLIQVDDVYALQSVIYSRSGMEKVLRAIRGMDKTIPLDVLIKEKVLCDGNCYCSFPILTTQIKGKSDIEGKIKDWSRVLQDRFYERTKHLA